MGVLVRGVLVLSVVPVRGVLFVRLFGLLPGLLLVLLEFRLGVPAPVSDGTGLFRGGMPVLPLPGVVIDAGAGHCPIIRIKRFFTHIQTLSQ